MWHVLREQWTNPALYNFWSSAWGEAVFAAGKVVVALGVLRLVWPWVWRHFECDVESPDDCHRRGYPVHGTGHRACGEHHPRRHDKRLRPTTVEDILGHHRGALGDSARGDLDSG